MTRPTRHEIVSAIHLAVLLAEKAARLGDARETYWKYAIGGVVSPVDLQLGEELLLKTGLAVLSGGVISLSADLSSLLDGDYEEIYSVILARTLSSESRIGFDKDKLRHELAADPLDELTREDILLSLGQRFNDELRQQVGVAGEIIVEAAARAELRDLGHADLARAVQRVSLRSDQLGYDITAPRIGGGKRLLEVKATRSHGPTAIIYLTRNEAEVGIRLCDWALVLCRVDEFATADGEVIGWCTGAMLEPILPRDNEAAKWSTAEVTIAVDALIEGLPPAY